MSITSLSRVARVSRWREFRIGRLDLPSLPLEIVHLAPRPPQRFLVDVLVRRSLVQPLSQGSELRIKLGQTFASLCEICLGGDRFLPRLRGARLLLKFGGPRLNQRILKCRLARLEASGLATQAFQEARLGWIAVGGRTGRRLPANRGRRPSG